MGPDNLFCPSIEAEDSAVLLKAIILSSKSAFPNRNQAVLPPDEIHLVLSRPRQTSYGEQSEAHRASMLGFVPTVAMTSPVKPPSVHVRHVSSEQDLTHALAVRQRVFVEEMGIPSTQEFDAFDAWPLPAGITHFLVLIDTRPIATCRVNTMGIPGAKLERMAVDKVARRNGVGLALLRHIERAKVVEESRGPFYCYAMKHKELFYRNSGWSVESGHFSLEEAGIPHVAMIRRRRPRGAGSPNGGSMSHVMVRTWDILRARRFYSLLGFQDETRFLTNGLKAAWIQVRETLIVGSNF